MARSVDAFLARSFEPRDPAIRPFRVVWGFTLIAIHEPDGGHVDSSQGGYTFEYGLVAPGASDQPKPERIGGKPVKTIQGNPRPVPSTRVGDHRSWLTCSTRALCSC